jgi:serine/threonine-protein kinase HipA
MNKLFVYINSILAGELWIDDQNRFCFQYSKKWLGEKDSFHLSVSLPLQEKPFLNDSSYSYFTNLLPEGKVLTALSRKLGIAEEDKFSLLRAIGGDCAGAVSLYPPDIDHPGPGDYKYEPFSGKDLAEKITELTINPLLAAEERRLSLAGGMEKLPVYIKNNQIYLPLNGAPTTHIIKTPVKELQGIVTNEAYCMNLAKKLGFDVPESDILKVDDIPLYAVKRYDRIVNEQGIVRLVQEDFCQALNRNSQQKYNYSLKDCFDLIRKECSNPIEDSRKFLNLIFFNGLIGNADGHAKNISLLHDENGTKLAPLYDLVSTQIYPQFTKKMPMKIGGKKRNFSHLQKHHFVSLSEEINMKSKVVVKTALDLATKIIAFSETAAIEFKTKYGSIEIVDKINALISFHARSLIDTLSKDTEKN